MQRSPMAKNSAPKRNNRHTLVRALVSYRLARGKLSPAQGLKPLWRTLIRGCLAGTTLEK